MNGSDISRGMVEAMFKPIAIAALCIFGAGAVIGVAVSYLFGG